MPQHDDHVIKKVIHLKEKGWIPNEKDKRNLSRETRMDINMDGAN